MTYSGIKHPVQRKAALVVPVARLPLANEAAVHKFKILAGTRWSIDPPKDAGIGKDEAQELSVGQHGYFKISHESFPELAMNLKWCSDALDELMVEANVGVVSLHINLHYYIPPKMILFAGFGGHICRHSIRY